MGRICLITLRALYIHKLNGYVWISGYLDGDTYPDFYIEINGTDAITLHREQLDCVGRSKSQQCLTQINFFE